MSITGDAVVTTPPSAQLPETTVIRSWKTPIALAIFSVLFGVLLLAAPRAGETTFHLSTAADALQLPEILAPVMPTAWIISSSGCC